MLYSKNRSQHSSTAGAAGVGTILLGGLLALSGESQLNAQMPLNESAVPPAATRGAGPEELTLNAPLLNVPTGAELIDGSFIEGTPVALAEGKLTLRGSDGQVNLDIDTVLHLQISSEQIQSETEGSASLLLHDGTLLLGSQVEFSRGKITLSDNDSEQQVVIPREERFEHVRAIFSRAVPEELKAELNTTIATVEDDYDRVVLFYPDEARLKVIECHVGHFDAKEATLAIDENSVTADCVTSKRQIIGVIFRRDDNATDIHEDTATVSTLAGETILADEVTVGDDQLTIKIAGGAVEFTRALESIASIDLSRDKVYALDRLRVRDLALPSPELMAGEHVRIPRFNRSLNGAALTIAGNTHEKGLSLQSGTSIEFRLPADMKFFEATAAIDDSVRSSGDLVLKIYSDGSGPDTPLYSKRITAEDAPEPVKIEIEGSRRLRIEVDPGGNLYFGDLLHLGSARVRK